MKIKKIAKELVSLTVLQINELSKILHEKYGIDDISLTTNTQNPQTSAHQKTKEKVQTKFDLILKTPGQSKLAVIKLIRSLTGHGLKDSKELVDKVPSIIKSNLNKAEAELLIKEFYKIGALAELK
ncbi:50S ribosomal protein L7/L12 [Candidatus Karelsulcia muelleri]|uniref:50S ribosomal protein L7/L12 n=1 Tax=Candidatus Karelsulcia muelleri TaxID=336810 RepID=A0A346E156_9FLAO|nr:50S ribosomal protein L7/L12 [Candidatus Karelsulcia muelleri]AXN02711.1 LSU ribosomal protein L7/L12 (P1/P2) [Candidatus Karelsulcia muelleri]WDI79501.1 50S ribosomal protein L7/L12 [Candidatus Karelsulcia muelleri]WDR78959.1 50S ribosomal protein L7/L12 [Candidatus Karelsulcia muelleri]